MENLDTVKGLTHEELIRIVVALDNEAHSVQNAGEVAALRKLKWKVFSLSVEVQPTIKEAR